MNSFETLGLLPYFIEGLNEQETLTIARHMVKALQFVYHPDKRPDAYLKSMAINEAIRNLESSTYSFEEEKGEYLESGPGQRETRAMKNQFEALLQNVAVLDANIKESEIREDNIKAKIRDEIEKVEEWIYAFYSKSENEYPDEMFDKIDPDIKSKIDVLPGFPMGNILGRKIIVADFEKVSERTELEAELKEKKDEYEVGHEGETWEVALRDARTDIQIYVEEKRRAKKAKRNREERLEEAERNLKIYRNDLKRIEDEKRGLENEIRVIEQRLLALSDVEFAVRVNEHGYLEGPGITGKMRPFGSVALLTDSGDLKKPIMSLIVEKCIAPAVIKGAILSSMDENYEIGEIGLVRDIEGLGKEKEGRKKRTSRPADKETEKTHETEEFPKEKALVRKGDLAVRYKKNPFETIGLLPSIVAEFGEEELKGIVKMLATGLSKALHPDVSKHSSSRFSEINEALSLLADPKMFTKAKKEYDIYKAGELQRKAIEAEMEKVKGKIGERAKELAAARMKEEREKAHADEKIKRSHSVLNHFLTDIYSAKDRPDWKDGRYLHHADGLELTIGDGSKTHRYKIKNEGFDVWAVSGDKRFRVFGCVPSDEFGDINSAKTEIAGKELYDCLGYVYPVLSKNDFVVFEANDRLLVRGKIISLNESVSGDKKQDTKKIARELSERIKQQDSSTKKPKKRSKRNS